MANRAAPGVAQLVIDHHQALYRYAYRLTGSAADAEDLTQQVFLIAQQKSDQVRTAEGARAWLFTVLRNCYLKSRRRASALPVLADVDVNQVPAEVSDEIAKAIESEALQQAINILADEFKLVVLMFYFEELPYREIAERLEIPIGTVMSRLARAKAHLRQSLLEKPAGETRTDPTETNQNSTRILHPTATRR